MFRKHDNPWLRVASFFSLVAALCVAAHALAPHSLAAQEKKVTFDDHIKPIFRQRCASCHNGDQKIGGLDVTNMTNLMQGGNSGSVIEPGDASESYLFQLVNHDEEPIMPPKSDKIPAAEIMLIAEWIDGGALENKNSVSTAPKKPKLNMAVDSNAAVRPQVIAMPPRLSLQPIVSAAKPTTVNSIAVSPWAPIAAVSSTKQILLYNTKTNRMVGVLPFPEGTANILKFSRNGQLLLAGGGRGGASGKVIVWNVITGKRMIEVGDELDTVLAADISNDHSLVALGGPKKMLRVYNTESGELEYQVKKHTDWITALEFSPDGVLLASGDRNGGVFVWEAETGNEYLTLKGHTKQITSISWRIDSNIVATASEDVSVRLWEVENGRMVKNWGAHGGGVSDLQFTREGNLVSCGRDRVTKLWNQNGGQIRAFKAFPDIAVSCAFCNETKSVISSDWNGSIGVFNSADGKLKSIWSMNPKPLIERFNIAKARRDQLAAKSAPAKTAYDNANKALTDTKAKLTQQQASLTQLTNSMNQSNAQLQATQKQRAQLQAQYGNYQKAVTSNTQAKPLVEQSLAKAKEALAKLPNDASLKKTVTDLTTKLASINQVIVDNGKLIATTNQQIAANKSKATSLQSSFQKMNQQKTVVTNTIAALNKQLPNLQTQFNTANQNLNTISQQVATAQSRVNFWTAEIAFDKMLRELQAKQKAASDSFSQANQVVQQKKAELDEKQKALDTAKAESAKRKQVLDQIESEIRKAQGIQ